MAGFQSEEKDGVHLIKCPPTIDAQELPIEPLVKAWLLSPMDVHVVDFKETINVKSNAYRGFLLLNQQLKANKKTLFALNLNPKILTQFKQDGLNGIFVAVSSVDEARRKASPAKMTVDVELINPFIDATKKIIEVQAKISVTPGKPRIRKPDEHLPIEIAGVISMASKQFTGSIVLCFPSAVFLKIYQGLTNEKWDAITKETEDAAAEILNMIYGQAKTVLNQEKGYEFETTIPTVLTGEKLKLTHRSRSPSILIPLESPAGLFHLEILLERS